jgi:hypothetical protein
LDRAIRLTRSRVVFRHTLPRGPSQMCRPAVQDQPAGTVPSELAKGGSAPRPRFCFPL